MNQWLFLQEWWRSTVKQLQPAVARTSQLTSIKSWMPSLLLNSCQLTAYLLKNRFSLWHQWTGEKVRNLRQIQHILPNSNTYAMSWLGITQKVNSFSAPTKRNQNLCKIVWCTHIIRRGKYSIRKILNRKVVLGGDLNEGHFCATILRPLPAPGTLPPRCDPCRVKKNRVGPGDTCRNWSLLLPR